MQLQAKTQTGREEWEEKGQRERKREAGRGTRTFSLCVLQFNQVHAVALNYNVHCNRRNIKTAIRKVPSEYKIFKILAIQ